MQLYKKRIFVEQNYTSSMKKEEKVRLPYVPTYGEEVANTVSHAVMLPLTLCLLPFAAVWTYPVSYTHLDVYKRQIVACSRSTVCAG